MFFNCTASTLTCTNRIITSACLLRPGTGHCHYFLGDLALIDTRLVDNTGLWDLCPDFESPASSCSWGLSWLPGYRVDVRSGCAEGARWCYAWAHECCFSQRRRARRRRVVCGHSQWLHRCALPLSCHLPEQPWSLSTQFLLHHHCLSHLLMITSLYFLVSPSRDHLL